MPLHAPSFVPTLPQEADLSRDSILLHCCCAPCSTAIVEWMVESGLRPTLFFSNSNIVPLHEYELRREELVRYAAANGLLTVDDEYDHAAWLEFVSGQCRNALIDRGVPADEWNMNMLREIPERGPRCVACFKFRLLRAAEYAAANGYSLLTTTLASSRWKVISQVDEAGIWACGQVSQSLDDSALQDGTAGTKARNVLSDSVVRDKVLWWSQNWRKGGLQERRNCLIKELDMYNQTYCGCEFSAHK